MSDVRRVEKPWGYELHWAHTDRYVGKVLHVKKGHALSLQYHNIKEETIHVYTGKILFEIDVDGQLVGREMGPGESVHVTPKTIHRMTALDSEIHFPGQALASRSATCRSWRPSR